MKKLVLIFLILMTDYMLFSTIVVKLKEINRPDTICVDKDYLYISENASIYIYSVKNYRLIKRFGKRGEGPEEFIPYRLGLLINVVNKNIFISSMGKMSVFSKNGIFKKEIKASSGKEFQPLDFNFIGWEFYQEDKTTYRGINIYDSYLKKKKEITRLVHSVQEGKGFKIFSARLILKTYKNQIFMSGGEEFIIDRYNKNEKKLLSINQEYKKIRIKDKDKKNVMDFFKTDRRYKKDYEIIKKLIRFPDYFPCIRSFFISDDKIYVRTYNQSEEEAEFFIFNLNGRLIKKLFLPITAQNPKVLFLSYPYTINNEKIYELIDNVEREEWELHVTNIE